ncbi:MAG: translation initiation factor IF-3 [Oscillospiraceae bacterium]|nr:translation initiation factor IF-3 [Oscillospiraceae bacterium]
MLLIATNTTYQINDDIRDREVRLIGEDGEQLGILSSADALKTAVERRLDLVKISPQANPPVCKIMDYGKYKFEQGKRDKEARRNQHIVEIKEVRLSPGIGAHDFGWKLDDGKRFLQQGDRLKVTVVFRGREMAHTNIGEDLLKKFAGECDEIATVDKNPKLEGRRMSMFLSPRINKSDVKAAKAKSQAEAAPKPEETPEAK